MTCYRKCPSERGSNGTLDAVWECDTENCFSPLEESSILFLKEKHALSLCHTKPCWSLGARRTELCWGYVARMLQEKGQALSTVQPDNSHMPKLTLRP